jgi:hypothetical protein
MVRYVDDDDDDDDWKQWIVNINLLLTVSLLVVLLLRWTYDIVM